jgi:hypothetical protein
MAYPRGGAGNSALPSESVVRGSGHASSCPSQAMGTNFWFAHLVFTEVPDHLISQIVQHIDQPRLVGALVLPAHALHDVEVGIGVQNLRVAASVLVVRLNQRVDTVWRPRSARARCCNSRTRRCTDSPHAP